MAINVTVGQFPSRDGVRPVTLDDGATVAQALSVAGLATDGFDIRVNGNAADPSTVLNNGDSVILVRKIKGN